MIGIVLKKRNALGKKVCLIITVAGGAGLDLLLSATRFPCFTGLVMRGHPGTLPVTCASRRGLRALCFAVPYLAPRSPEQVLPDTASVVRSSIGATVPVGAAATGPVAVFAPRPLALEPGPIESFRPDLER